MSDRASRRLLDQLCAALSPEARRSVRTADDALHAACTEGLPDLAASLASKLGADVNAGCDGISPLHRAAANGHHAVCRVLVMELGAKVGAVCRDGSTALHEAAEMCYEETVRVLVSELGANINAKRRSDGWTALHIAAKSDALEVAQVLFTNGANVGATCYKGMTPLCHAASYGKKAVARALISFCGADVDARSDCGGSALHYAARGNACGMLRMLARFMGNHASDVRCADGRTPLHWAAMTGANAAVRLLISELGADIMAVDANGFTPLHHAAHGGYIETTSLLAGSYGGLGVGALKVATFGRLHTPLHLAVLSGQREVTETLLYAGAEVGAKDSAGRTALHYAVTCSRVDLMREMVKKFGADTSAITNDGRTVIGLAEEMVKEEEDEVCQDVFPSNSRGKSSAAVEATIILKMSVALEDAKRNSGWTALHRAAFDGDNNMVELLRTRGASPHVRDFDGRTPLHLAAIGDHGVVLRYICGHFISHVIVDVNARDHEGRTPLFLADAWGSHEASQTLAHELRADKAIGGRFCSVLNF